MRGRIGWRDARAASGPAFLAAVFAFVLYAIQVPINLVVLYGIGLLYWPAYELAGLIAERVVASAFASSTPERWRAFRNGFFPLAGIGVAIALFAFRQWFWLVVFCQCLRLVFVAPGTAERDEDKVRSLVTLALLALVTLLAIVGMPSTLSSMFRFPNVQGDLVYLPGMLILGAGYYALMAVGMVLMRAK